MFEIDLSAIFDATALGIPYVLKAVDKAAARLLSFKRLLRASGLGFVSLASHRQTVDADTPRRWANSACDSLPRSRRISSPVITGTSLESRGIGNNRRAAAGENTNTPKQPVNRHEIGPPKLANALHLEPIADNSPRAKVNTAR